MKARGSKELDKYIDGKRLTTKQMILAKCFECCGEYEDGKEDCTIPECPLYPMMPYGSVWKGRVRGKIPPGFRKGENEKTKSVSNGKL